MVHSLCARKLLHKKYLGAEDRYNLFQAQILRAPGEEDRNFFSLRSDVASEPRAAKSSEQLSLKMKNFRVTFYVKARINFTESLQLMCSF